MGHKLRFLIGLCALSASAFAAEGLELTNDPFCALGRAADFGSFSTESTSVRHSDISGRVACGKDLITNHFAVGCPAYKGHVPYTLKDLPPTVERQVYLRYPSGELQTFPTRVNVYTSIPSSSSFAIYVHNKFYRGFGTTCGVQAFFGGWEKHPKVFAPADELGRDLGMDLSRSLLSFGELVSVDYIANHRKSIIDFGATSAALVKQSKFWASLPSSTPLVQKDVEAAKELIPVEAEDIEAQQPELKGVKSTEQLTFEGRSAKVNVFSVSSERLLNARLIEINVPEGATALINVSGSRVIFARVIMQAKMGKAEDRQQLAARVLWNFFEAKTVETISYEKKHPWKAYELLGTFFAPLADVHLAQRYSVLKDGCRELHWFGSLIIGAVIGKTVNLMGLNDTNFKDSDDADAKACDVTRTRGNGQINQFSFTGWLPIEAGKCAQVVQVP